MEPIKIGFLVFFGLILILAGIQKYIPGFSESTFNEFLTKQTILFFFLILSCIFMLFLLKSICWTTSGCAREGFENETEDFSSDLDRLEKLKVSTGNKAIDIWKELVKSYQLEKVCRLQKSITEKITSSEKMSGAAQDPERKVQIEETPDVIARMNAENVYIQLMPNGPFSCETLEKLNSAADIDTFFVEIGKVPNDYLVRAFQSAAASYRLLERQYNKANQSIKKPEIPQVDTMEIVAMSEGFENPNQVICSPEIIEERRKFIREKKLSDAAQRCLLPEEVPLEKKDAESIRRIETLVKELSFYLPEIPYEKGKEKPIEKKSIPMLLNDADGIQNKLDALQARVESGEIFNDIKIKDN